MRNPFQGSGTAWASRQVVTRSILNPILWLNAIVWPSTLAALTVLPPDLRPVVLIVACSCVGVAVVAYGYFSLRDPDRLQSEDFVLQQQMVARLGDNRTREEISLPGGSGELLTENKALEGHGG